MVSGDCCVALPRDTIGLSAVCDCGICWLYSLNTHIFASLRLVTGGIVLCPRARHFFSCLVLIQPKNT